MHTNAIRIILFVDKTQFNQYYARLLYPMCFVLYEQVRMTTVKESEHVCNDYAQKYVGQLYWSRFAFCTASLDDCLFDPCVWHYRPITNSPNSTESLKSKFLASAFSDSYETKLVVDEPAFVVLSPRMQSAVDYVTRRYRVSEGALVPVFELAQSAGRERRIDPLLIVAVIGIESGFNPFAESPLGARA